MSKALFKTITLRKVLMFYSDRDIFRKRSSHNKAANQHLSPRFTPRSRPQTNPITLPRHDIFSRVSDFPTPPTRPHLPFPRLNCRSRSRSYSRCQSLIRVFQDAQLLAFLSTSD
jgi:hypothetical protein